MKNVTSAVSLISTVCHVTDWGVQKCNSKSLTKARTSARKGGQLDSDKFFRSAATTLWLACAQCVHVRIYSYEILITNVYQVSRM